MEAIKLFMWGYQRYFQDSVQVEAEKLFRALDPSFEVETFLLGLVRNESPEDHPICLEPEECGFEPNDFASVRDDAKHNLAVAPDRNMITWEASAQASIDRRRNDRADKSAVIKALAGKHHGANGEFFFSGFMPVANYEVGIVLRLNHRYRISHYHLPHTHEGLQVPKSLVESAVNIFLQACRKSLNTGGPHPLDHGAHKISATFADCCHFYFCLTVIHSALFNPLEKRERAVPGTARPPFPFSQGSQLYRRRRSVFKPFALAGLVIK